MAFVDNFQDFIKYHAEAAGMTREEFMAVLMSENKKKPGPDPYHRGLEDDEVEDKEEQIKKQAKMDDDDPDAYKEMPGDKEAREKGEVKTSKATKAYNKLYGEDLDESAMSDIHQMAGEAKSKEDFIKRFFKEYGAKVKKTKDSEEWAGDLYDDMNESVNERAAMGYDGHTGLFYFEGVPFTQERLDEVIAWLKETVIKAAKDLPKQFSYRPAIQIEDEVGGEQVTFDTNKIKYLEYIRKSFKGKLAHDEDFNESKQIGEANEQQDKMAFSQLERIIDYATMLRDRMAAGKGLDAWMYGKIVKAEDYLNTLYDVIDGDDGVVETQKMTNKDWKKIKKFNKHVTDSGEKFVMSYDDRIGTFLEPVEIVDEGVLSNVRKAIAKTQGALKKKWAKKGGYENFGQDEIRDLQDKYDYHGMVYGTPEERKAAKLIDALDQWAMNYVGESTVNEAFKFGKKNQYSIDDVNEAYGFWGTLEAGGFKRREIEDCWHSAMAWLTENYRFSDAGALYYLNAKAGRWIADQVIENKGRRDVVDVLEDYATDAEWKKWSKEYNKYAQEEMMQEAKRGDIHKAAKKGSYPATVVVINSGMVVKQEIVKTPAAVPAVFNELQAQYPDAIISVESKTGETLFSESVVNEVKEYKAGDTVKLKTGETVKIKQVVKGPRPQFNTYRAKIKGKLVDFGLTDINEADDKDQKSTDRGPLDDDKIETALKKKAEDTGVPIGIIRAVMRRGLAAWKSGHRPGANQQQWGYARVNAFLTKGEGTWGKADKDLAKEVRDGGHDKKLKKA